MEGCNWPPRFCAAFSGWLATFFARAIQRSFSLSPRISPADFITAEEVWERLQKRAIDVHFLMIAVAVGAACIGAWAEGATLLFLFSLVRRAGTLRAGPHAKGNPLAVPRRAENRHGARRSRPRTRSARGKSSRRDEAAHQTRRAISRGRGNLPKARPPPTNPISPAKPRPWKKMSATRFLPEPSILWGAVEIVGHETRRRKFAAKNHHAHPRSAAAKSARATIHRQVQHGLHLFRARAFVGDVFCLVAWFRPCAVHFQCRDHTARFIAR